jgi:hypothetical protein
MTSTTEVVVQAGTKNQRPRGTERETPMSMITATNVDEGLVAEATHMRHRAESLRQQAADLDEVLGMSYRRRASELEMEAWVLEVRAGVPEKLLHHAA